MAGGTWILHAVLGGAIVLATCVGLVWNEWRAAGQADALAMARAQVVTLAADRLPQADGPVVVHVSGDAVADRPIVEPLLGTPVEALRLDRVVEMYQWREIQEGGQNDRIVRYEGVWAPDVIDSRRYRDLGRVNPSRFPVPSVRHLAEDVRIGLHRLSPDLLAAAEALPYRPTEARLVGDGIALNFVDGFYWSGDPAKPKVGDVRVRFAILPEGPLSVLGRSQSGTIEPLIDRNGKPVALIAVGLLDPDDLLGPAAAGNAGEVWKGRAIMAFIMLIGVMIMQKPLFAAFPIVLALGGDSPLRAGLLATLVISVATSAAAWFMFRSP
jgi:hypothetical protein